MELQAAYGFALMFSKGSVAEAAVALNRALLLAEVNHDAYNQMRLLGALDNYHQRIGDMRGALAVAQRARAVAEQLNDSACSAMAGWLSGISFHLMGDQLQAQRYGLAAWSEPPRSQIVNRVRFGFDDHRIRGLCGLTRAQWLLGYPDQACVTAYRVIDEAARMGHPIALATAWVWVTPVLLWSGDHEGARTEADKLISHAEQHALEPYKQMGRGILGQLAVETGGAALGLEMLSAFHEMLRGQHYGLLLAVFSAPLSQALADLGRGREALEAIDFALGWAERGGGAFDWPELLRIKGTLLAAAATGPDTHEAEQLLLRSIEMARCHSILAWELRSIMSLSRLQLQQGRAAEAHTQLQAVLERFTEGWGTTDLLRAKRMLEELAAAQS
jgi:hypothetical protein